MCLPKLAYWINSISMNRNIFLLAIAATISLYSCKSGKEEDRKAGGKPKGLKAEGYVLTAGVFQNDYHASGTLLPNEEVDIHPEIAGRITSINFKEGSFVRKGQTLVTLYDADIRAQIQKLKAQKALQSKIQDRQSELLKIGGISKQDFETTETQIASIDADIAIQEAQLRKTKIVAPFDGIIGIRSISNGAIVSSTTSIATLQQVNPLKMDFTVPEQYFRNLKVNQLVYFNVSNDTADRTGKIAAIDPGADVNTRSVKVRAIVPNEKGRLVSGSFAEVRIPFESDNNALLIPSQAVIPTTRDKKVAVVKNGKADFVVVELGARTADKVEVIKGLTSGDTVITTGLMQVKPGMEVTINKIRS